MSDDEDMDIGPDPSAEPPAFQATLGVLDSFIDILEGGLSFPRFLYCEDYMPV